MNTQPPTLRSIHPFPARMAPSIIQRRLKSAKPMRVVDPMVGSGTTIVTARLYGHQAVGFDTDPLALLIATAWSSDIDPDRMRALAIRTLNDARVRYRSLTMGKAYPQGANHETRAFIRFWFDATNRRQLRALASSIAKVRERNARAILWCAFSRMIITKGAGVSLAIDVSHSRPHRAHSIDPIRPFDKFPSALEQVLRGSHFPSRHNLPAAEVRRGDARAIPLDDNSVDLVITSPPYLNAIDYLRGHKLSLVWMGHQIDELRELRSGNIGSERFHSSSAAAPYRAMAEQVARGFADLPARDRAMLVQYFGDMDRVLAEINRILKRAGTAVIVVGNSTIRGIFINNSRMLTRLARGNGLRLVSARRRVLQENRRYLPPPGHAKSGASLRSRMNEEVILAFQKMPLLSGARRS
jgi:SAM-dependent methyltransferase